MRFTKRGHEITADCLMAILRMGYRDVGRTEQILSLGLHAVIGRARARSTEETRPTPIPASSGSRKTRIQKGSWFEAS